MATVLMQMGGGGGWSSVLEVLCGSRCYSYWGLEELVESCSLGTVLWALVLHTLENDMLNFVLLSLAPFVVFDVTGCIAHCGGMGVIQ